MKTHSTTPKDIKREWHVIDAQEESLGRLASRVAQLLKGKNKTYYAPHMDTGDNVIVINAAKLRLTGDKIHQKNYYRHSLYPGGLHVTSLEVMLQKRPERVVEKAVHGMLPKNILGRQMIRKLHVYAGPDHPHQAQIQGQENAKKAAAQ